MLSSFSVNDILLRILGDCSLSVGKCVGLCVISCLWQWLIQPHVRESPKLKSSGSSGSGCGAVTGCWNVVSAGVICSARSWSFNLWPLWCKNVAPRSLHLVKGVQEQRKCQLVSAALRKYDHWVVQLIKRPQSRKETAVEERDCAIEERGRTITKKASVKKKRPHGWRNRAHSRQRGCTVKE